MAPLKQRLDRYMNAEVLRSPAARLTGWYVLILMILSIVFSFVLYHFAVGQLVRGLSRQYMQIGPPSGLPFDPAHIPAQVQANSDTGRHNLVIALIYFNVVILLVSGFLSYWLAKRTLRPIEAALEAQSRFSADASHELRTPLAVMQTEIEIARSDPKLTHEEALALLDSNLEEVKKLHHLSDGLLRLARSESKPLVMTSVVLANVAEEAAGRVAALAKLRGIMIRLDTAPVSARGDHESLVELTAILLDNAIKYSEPGQAITITTSKHGHTNWLSVSDTGRGIAPKDLPKIFDRFYRADKSRTGGDIGGHGLGLSLAKKIAEIHNGEITASSRFGHGSTFTIKLSAA